MLLMFTAIGTDNSGYICYDPCAAAKGYGAPGFPSTHGWGGQSLALNAPLNDALAAVEGAA